MIHCNRLIEMRRQTWAINSIRDTEIAYREDSPNPSPMFTRKVIRKRRHLGETRRLKPYGAGLLGKFLLSGAIEPSVSWT